MTEANNSTRFTGFATNVARRNKALKIVSILREHAGCEGRFSLLDIGTGNGEIAYYLGEFYDVVSVDVTDQREVYDGFTFIQFDGEKLPFSDKSFDIVVSNHVIEHVANADLHLSEIWRVLKDKGIVYLATPNRLWPWEAHNKIFLLHYLPALRFSRILKLMGKYHEDVFLMTWWALRRKIRKFFAMNIVSDHITKWPLKYYMQCSPSLAKILSLVPLGIYRMFIFINPTLVVVLKK